jgi:hypothetical protein
MIGVECLKDRVIVKIMCVCVNLVLLVKIVASWMLMGA